MIERFLSEEKLSIWRERLNRTHSVQYFDEINNKVKSFTAGDRIVFYVLAILVAVTALGSLYVLEQSILVTVPTYGGTLIEGEIGSPRFMNPLLAISDADRDLSVLTYAGLMGLSESGEIVPVIAESYTVSEDGKIYTFTLRESAKFSDGSPVTSSDILFTVQKAQDQGLKSPEYANWSGVGVSAVDSRTVRFTLSKPYAPFISITTLGILPARLWQNISNEEFPFSTLQTSPVGAGPFIVTNISRDASGLIKSAELKANSTYALGRPYLDKLVFNFYSRIDDLERALSNGEIDSAHDLVSKDAITAPYARVFGVFFNPNEKQVFSRAEVREALSKAINRDDIVNKVLSGYATSITGPVPPGSAVHQNDTSQPADLISDAASVLKKAGWNYDSDARMWKHVKAKLSLDNITIRTSNVPELRSVAGAVKTDLEKLGVPVTIELYEPGDLSQNVIRPRKYEALLYGMVIGRDQDLYAFWHSQERNDPGLNIALYANKTIDSLLEEVRTSADTRKREEDLQKIQNTIEAEYPAAFIYSPDFTYVVPKTLYGIELPQMVTPSDRFAGVTKWYRFIDKVWPFLIK